MGKLLVILLGVLVGIWRTNDGSAVTVSPLVPCSADEGSERDVGFLRQPGDLEMREPKAESKAGRPALSQKANDAGWTWNVCGICMGRWW